MEFIIFPNGSGHKGRLIDGDMVKVQLKARLVRFPMGDDQVVLHTEGPVKVGDVDMADMVQSFNARLSNVEQKLGRYLESLKRHETTIRLLKERGERNQG